MKKKIYLVDVSSLFFRAYYAVRPLTSPAGLPVNAIYGYLSMLLKLIKDEKPEYMAFCYDRKEPSFRKDLYNEYKANRTEMPDDLSQQMPYIRKVDELLGVSTLEVPSFEADDLIGTLSQIANKNDFEVYIVSGDKDFAQLVTPSIKLFDTMKNVRLGPQEVFEKWGVHPESFIDYLALVGDSSDNVPGVKGIGPKGAIKLLEEFKTLHGIYAGVDSIKNENLKNKLLDSRENAFLSQKLVSISLDVPLSQDMETYKRRNFDLPGLEALFTELNFKNFLNQVKELSLQFESSSAIADSGGGATSRSVETGPAAVLEQGAFAGVLAAPVNTSAEFISEADILNYKNELQSGYYFLFANQVYCLSEDKILQLPEDLNWSLPFLPSRGFDLKLIWHKLNVNLFSLENFNETLSFFDTMLISYTVYSADATEDLKVFKRFQLVDDSQKDLLESKETTSAIKLQTIGQLHLNLNQLLKQKITESNFKELYEKFESPLLPILYNMEKRGVSLNVKELQIYSKELEMQIQNIEAQIINLAGEKFNVASPKQLGKILFEKLNIATGKKTKTGYSTDTDVLEKIEHPIANLVLTYRELAKLKSTYVDALPQLVGLDQRIHTRFNQALTTTGRLSSTNPNIQNIPIRTENGQRVRRAFQAEMGKKLLSIDYSQIELRILAHISDDPGLIQAFQNDLDIHAATAAEVFNVPLEKVTSDLRRTAKAINFGIAYGQGAFGLAENLGIPRKEAQDIINNYFSKFRGVHNYIEETIRKAHEAGYVETLFGRKRIIEELKSKNPALKKFGERAAINAPIQGSASDLVKLAMIQISKTIKLPMLLQVHDELIFEGTVAEIDSDMQSIVKIMESIAKLKVPLKVNSEVTERWGE